MSAAELCFAALNSASESDREGLLTAVVITSALCGLFSFVLLIKATTPTRLFCCVGVRRYGGKRDSDASGALNRRLLYRYFWFMTAASFSGAITWYSGLRNQQGNLQADAISSDDCPSKQALKAASQSWNMLYFIFKPISFISGNLALVIPLLRLFDISNIRTGSKKRQLTRCSRAIVAVLCASCFALSLISCWYGAYVSSRLQLHFSVDSEALCSANSSIA
jgi:hypothetical protein